MLGNIYCLLILRLNIMLGACVHHFRTITYNYTLSKKGERGLGDPSPLDLGGISKSLPLDLGGKADVV